MHATDVVDHLRSLLPYSIFFIFPILIIISPINPIEAAHDFTVYRLQQFDNAGAKIGSRSAVVSFEARTLGARSLTRKCLILRLMEVTGAVIRSAIAQNVGGVLILLPDRWTESTREHFLRLERELTSDEYLPSVVFARDSPALSAIYEEVLHSVHADAGISAAAAGFQAVLSTGYQLEMSQVASPGQGKGAASGLGARPMSEHEVVCLHGKLAGSGVEESLPTVVIVAHYDAYGAAPGLSHGADSNGSGALALLELARLFSRLYRTSRTHAKYNLVFLLSGAGKFNYYGTKKWLDDHLEGAESGILSDVALVVNLEALSGGPTLHMHVSKPPKEGTPGAAFLVNLQQVARALPSERQVAMVHKKINLAEEALAWEHERFSIRRLPGLTVTHHAHHDSPERRSLLDTAISFADVAVNTQLIGEALARLLFNVTGFESGQLLLDKQWLSRDLLESLWNSTLSRYPLAAQMLHRRHPVLATMQAILEQHLQEVRISAYKPDKRDPEVMFYDGFIYKMTAHNVKSTIFDFVLCCFICGYLAALYFGMQHLPLMLNSMSTLLMPNGAKKLKAL